MYADLKQTQEDCNFARAVFQREYGLADTDIIHLHSESLKYCDKYYRQLEYELNQSQVNTLVFHIFVGYGERGDDQQTMLINEFDPERKSYALFKAEENIRNFARKCPFSYHVAAFNCTQTVDLVERNYISQE